jgi:hypothetical protein
MTAIRSEQLVGGVCTELPIAIVDKYFLAEAFAERFHHLTAKAMCGRCAVQLACLTDALQLPAQRGAPVRGGESSSSIERLRDRLRAGEGSAAEIAAAAIARQARNGGLDGARELRLGHFSDATLIGEE